MSLKNRLRALELQATHHQDWLILNCDVAPNDEQLAKALAQLPETLGDY